MATPTKVETPEEARARTAATAAQNIADRQAAAKIETPVAAPVETQKPAVQLDNPNAAYKGQHVFDTTPDLKSQYASVSGQLPAQPPTNAQVTSVAPIQPSAPVIEQTATAAPKVETPKVESKKVTTPQVDYTKIAGRENEVLTNLNNAYNSGMTTPDAIKAFSDYNNASPEKRAFVDNFIAGKQVKPDENAIYTSILQGNTS